MTHVLNTAEGQTSGTVDTNEKFYKPFGIKYKGLKLLDVSQTNIAIHFNEVADFIDEAITGGGKLSINLNKTPYSLSISGKILVNCQMGVSRSSAAVLAYLMLRHKMTAVEALIEVKLQQRLTKYIKSMCFCF